MDAGHVLERLALARPESDKRNGLTKQDWPNLHPEGTTFCLESTPSGPFGLCINDLLGVESDMAGRLVISSGQSLYFTDLTDWKCRRKFAKQYMNPKDDLLSLPMFPRLGALP